MCGRVRVPLYCIFLPLSTHGKKEQKPIAKRKKFLDLPVTRQGPKLARHAVPLRMPSSMGTEVRMGCGCSTEAIEPTGKSRSTDNYNKAFKRWEAPPKEPPKVDTTRFTTTKDLEELENYLGAEKPPTSRRDDVMEVDLDEESSLTRLELEAAGGARGGSKYWFKSADYKRTRRAKLRRSATPP